MTRTQPLWNPPVNGWYENADGSFTRYHDKHESTTVQPDKLGLPRPASWLVRARLGSHFHRLVVDAETASEARARAAERLAGVNAALTASFTHTILLAGDDA